MASTTASETNPSSPSLVERWWRMMSEPWPPWYAGAALWAILGFLLFAWAYKLVGWTLGTGPTIHLHAEQRTNGAYVVVGPDSSAADHWRCSIKYFHTWGWNYDHVAASVAFEPTSPPNGRARTPSVEEERALRSVIAAFLRSHPTVGTVTHGQPQVAHQLAEIIEMGRPRVGGATAARAGAWMVVMLGAGLMASALVMGVARRFRLRAYALQLQRLNAGECPACKYPIHGLEHLRRCPECGCDTAAAAIKARRYNFTD